ncbi:MAG TPA: hypothetical protein VGJ94_09565 [Syntrophorhabdaceae bacterium]
MKLMFVTAAAVLAALPVMVSMQVVIDAILRGPSATANSLNLHEAPVPSALEVLVIPGLHLVFRPRRRS